MTMNNLQVSKPLPAIRLVSTKDMSRKDWLEVRKQGIGASEAASAIGINPYQSQLELWMIKTGRLANTTEDPFENSHSPMYWGNVLEPIVAEHYSRQTGRKVRRVNAVLQHPDEDKSWMLANLDYAVVGNSDVQVLECKTAGEFGARLWKDGVPDYYQCQVQHQLAITGKQTAEVAVLICGQEFRIYRIERDDELIQELISLEREFWSYVETDSPPPADGSESADRALRALYPQDHGHTLDLSNDPIMTEAFNELVKVRDSLDVFTTQEATLKQFIQQSMEDATKAVFKHGSVSWKKSKDSTTLDTTALLTDQPDLKKQYPLVKAGSRRFLIKANNPTQHTEGAGS
ncbi:hypothetical protein AI19_11815 [Thalassolituus oleivorans 4BN06-13]|nr:hypothetical protein [Thalassolituus oleivorans 4BN06-13]